MLVCAGNLTRIDRKNKIMSNPSSSFHHYHIRKRIYKAKEPFPHPDKGKRILDNMIYGAAILAPIMNLPQFFKIWLDQDATGVSLTSWASFSLFSLIWLVYGIVHKERPIIIMNFMLMIIQAGIAAGVVLYG